ncbi:MAG: tRNA preQ1(34) S-adenosylmethionine ribosyltransferase-isomerase QueA [Phycisphaerales bacterium]|nr:MAG: tRNA preQ1(34) S-adenosylmethionine ribosyltransferase-isomerase QueA [Phycisphaerales bacterium]
MKTERLDYNLPVELIAQAPAAQRSASRLLVLDRVNDTLVDSRFADLGAFLRPGDCLVLNDTKVLAARFFARRRTGAALEGLFLGSVGATARGCPGQAPVPAPTARADAPGVWRVMLKGARKVRPGERISIKDRDQRDFCTAELLEKQGDGVCLLRVETERSAEAVLDEVGFPPLPPYIRRDGDPAQAWDDRQRYQTVYARQAGAVAAPTAGLHFTEPLLEQLQAKGVRLARVTLHVGAGTFKPVTAEELETHEIHEEWFRLDAANAEIINAARAAGGRIVAVGTTATRVLETVATDTGVELGEGTTGLFITPGYEFKAVDAMITNFHLPKSTLLALVAAFAGLERTLAAYHHAIEQRYRFYSYGDAMLIL